MVNREQSWSSSYDLVATQARPGSANAESNPLTGTGKQVASRTAQPATKIDFQRCPRPRRAGKLITERRLTRSHAGGRGVGNGEIGARTGTASSLGEGTGPTPTGTPLDSTMLVKPRWRRRLIPPRERVPFVSSIM